MLGLGLANPNPSPSPNPYPNPYPNPNPNQVVFVIGPAGTGKTSQAVLEGLRLLKAGAGAALLAPGSLGRT